MLLAACVAACVPAPTVRPRESGPPAIGQQEGRTLVIAVRSEASSAAARALVATAFNVTPTSLFNAGLALKDERGVPHPYLAERLPQLDTDTWRVFPDGRMETVYRLRPNLTWHDGVPLAASDFVFAWRVYATPELGSAGSPPFSHMEELLAPEERTIVIRWRRPYPEAAAMQDRDFQALPRHVLESPFQQLAPDLFASHAFWTTDYVGLGPYRIDRTEPGAFLEAVAFEGYVLGRPKIGRIRVVYINDPNTVLANLLAESVHVALSNALPFQQGVILQREWAARGGGTIRPFPSLTAPIRRTEHQLHPDRLDPGSRALLDVRVRKALAHAVDRRALNDAIFEGEGVMADSPVPFTLDYFPEVDRAIVKYPHDLRRTEQLMADAGYNKGPDGFYMSPVQGRFTPEIKVIAGPQNEAGMAIMADGWRRAGFDFREGVLPAAQARDQQVRVMFSSMFSTDGGLLEGLGTTGIPTPESRWNGNNRSSWSNAAFDALVDLWNTTLNRTDRNGHMVEMARIYSDELPSTPMWYVLNLTAHVAAVQGPRREADSIHTWEFRPR